jgi:proton-translocating NADH-quinone oxidoreductase chain N
MNYTDIFQNHFKEVFPETYLLIVTIIILLYAVTYQAALVAGPIPSHATTHANKLTVLALLLTIGLLASDCCDSFGAHAIFNGTLIIDDLALLAQTIIVTSALCSILVSSVYNNECNINSFEYVLSISSPTPSMLLTVSSHDSISMYSAIELQTSSFYALAAPKRKDEFSTEAGSKYFVSGAPPSGPSPFGESTIHGLTGITNLEELTKLFIFWSYGNNVAQGASFGVLLMLAAFLFKISAAPLHAWSPDVYEGAPTCVTAFFAITPKMAILSLFLRLVFCTFWDIVGSWEHIIIVCSLLSMTIGTFGAINQNRVKRLFAYSSIAHVGYMLLAVASGTTEAAESLLLYIIIYVPMTIGIFGVILVLVYSTPRRRRPSEHIWRGHIYDGLRVSSSTRLQNPPQTVKYVTGLAPLSKANPVLAASLTITLFSNAGVPPLAGFYGKLNIFMGAIGSTTYFLASFGVSCATMGAFYSIRLVKIIYYHPSRCQGRPHCATKTIGKESAIILGLALSVTLFFFLYPSFLFVITHSAALSLGV